jgi:cytochrome c551/c552
MMRGRITLAVALPTALFLTLSSAQASEALSDKHGCDNCHAMDKKLIGPSFKAVAEKYRKQADANSLLAGKVLGGASGTWGAVAMPAMGHVPAADVQALVSWILKQ